jgi:hypothetical protein
MTNGEKLEQVFPDGICPFYKSWLDYEYKEPSTKVNQDLTKNKSEIPTSSDLSSGTRKNSKKLEKDFGELDCISRQAVLEQAYAYGNGLEPDGYCVNVEDIQALPSVTPQEPILDKIRAEIDKIYNREGNSFDCLNALDELKEFIDKYKAESENP